MKLIDDILGGIPNKIVAWIYKIVPNPSGQDQIQNHFLPAFFVTTLLVSIPRIGIYAGLLWVVASLYKELAEDLHYKDLFSKTDAGADGRVDLFFRLTGCGIAYMTLIWN